MIKIQENQINWFPILKAMKISEEDEKDDIEEKIMNDIGMIKNKISDISKKIIDAQKENKNIS